MAFLAVITKSEEIPLIVPWVAEFAKARQTDVTLACWVYSPVVTFSETPPESAELVEEVGTWLTESAEVLSHVSGEISVRGVSGPTPHSAVIPVVQREDVELLRI